MTDDIKKLVPLLDQAVAWVSGNYSDPKENHDQETNYHLKFTLEYITRLIDIKDVTDQKDEIQGLINRDIIIHLASLVESSLHLFLGLVFDRCHKNLNPDNFLKKTKTFKKVINQPYTCGDKKIFLMERIREVDKI